MTNRSETIFELRNALYDRGHTLASFARAHGISYPHVVRVVHDYWGTGRQPPRGILARRILHLLDETLKADPAAR